MSWPEQLFKHDQRYKFGADDYEHDIEYKDYPVMFLLCLESPDRRDGSSGCKEDEPQDEQQELKQH